MSHLHVLAAPARRQASRLPRRRLCQTSGSGHALALVTKCGDQAELDELAMFDDVVEPVGR
jgi:hypothetical protein